MFHHVKELKTEKEVQRLSRDLSKKRSAEVKKAVPSGENSWTKYDE